MSRASTPAVSHAELLANDEQMRYSFSLAATSLSIQAKGEVGGCVEQQVGGRRGQGGGVSAALCPDDLQVPFGGPAEEINGDAELTLSARGRWKAMTKRAIVLSFTPA